MTSYDPEPHDSVHALIEEFADIARRVHASDDVDESLERVTATAVHSISGCEAASISLLGKSGPYTRGDTHRLALDGDQIQYDEGEGPSLDAAVKDAWISTPDLGVDPRWPRSAARMAAELGVGSMFSCRLALDAAPNQTLGGLNLYATRPHAFGEQDQMLAILLASLAAIVIDASRQQANLRAAIETRQVIGEAIGIMRANSSLSRDQAFAALSTASQRMNVKLRDLAQQIADRSRPATLPED